MIHLAARVGGIGANQARPADLYLDNLLMGTYVLDEARRREHGQDRDDRHDLLVPEVHAGAVPRGVALAGLPRGDQRPVRHRQARPARAAAGQPRRSTASSAIYLMPTNLYGPGDKFHPAVSHVIPALIKKCVDAKESGADHIEVWGTGSASREFLYVDDAAEGIVLAAEHYDDGEPVNLGADHELPIRDLVEHHRRARRLRGRGPLGHVQARRPAPARRRRQPGREGVRLHRPHHLRRGPARHPRLVPGQPRRSRGPGDLAAQSLPSRYRLIITQMTKPHMARPAANHG